MMGLSLVQRITAKCGVSEFDSGTSYKSPRHTRAVEPLKIYLDVIRMSSSTSVGLL